MSVTIGGHSISSNSETDIDYQYYGVSYQLADGTYQHDNVSTDPKRNFTLKWNAVNNSTMTYIVDALEQYLTGGSTSFTDVNGTSYTVTVNRTSLKVKHVIGIYPYDRYNVQITLIEV